MDWIFGKKPTAKELQRENEKALRKAGRDVNRDRAYLEREEKKLMADIRIEASRGNHAGAKVLAGQLVKVRKQKTRTFGMNSKIQSVSSHNRMMTSNVAMADAMSNTASTMKNMNDLMKPEEVAAKLKNFQQAAMKMDMTDEMINDTLDDIFADSDEEQETDAVVNQVLDEIGIEISGKMRAAPGVEKGSIGVASKAKSPSEADLEAQLARLRSNE
uniref:Charged multivesicular body protein 2b-B n=1 Tax=Lygus hesperus TaxID=30085 RepID=A0A0A9XQ08_LYGHE